MELSKNSYLEKVIEVEDQSMRTIDTKLIDIANLERLTNQIVVMIILIPTQKNVPRKALQMLDLMLPKRLLTSSFLMLISVLTRISFIKALFSILVSLFS